MSAKFFGQYLLENNFLKPQQLLEAIEFQKSQSKTLGQLAVEEGLINPAQAQLINNEQRRTDKRFGEIAISMKLMTDPQIGQLLQLQKKNKLFFGEILVKLGFIEQEAVDAQLALFQQEQANEMNLISLNIKKFKYQKDIEILIDLIIKLYSRIIHEQIKISSIKYNKSDMKNHYVMLQKLVGQRDFLYVLDLSDKIILKIASSLIGKTYYEIDELTLDSGAEFLNIVLGNLAGNYSNRDIMVELEPQEVLEKKDFKVETGEQIKIEFLTSSGSFDLIMYYDM